MDNGHLVEMPVTGWLSTRGSPSDHPTALGHETRQEGLSTVLARHSTLEGRFTFSGEYHRTRFISSSEEDLRMFCSEYFP